MSGLRTPAEGIQPLGEQHGGGGGGGLPDLGQVVSAPRPHRALPRGGEGGVHQLRHGARRVSTVMKAAGGAGGAVGALVRGHREEPLGEAGAESSVLQHAQEVQGAPRRCAASSSRTARPVGSASGAGSGTVTFGAVSTRSGHTLGVPARRCRTGSGAIRTWALPRLLTRRPPSDARRTVRSAPARLSELVTSGVRSTRSRPLRPAHRHTASFGRQPKCSGIAVRSTGQAVPEFRGREYIAGPRKQ